MQAPQRRKVHLSHIFWGYLSPGYFSQVLPGCKKAAVSGAKSRFLPVDKIGARILKAIHKALN